MKALIFVVSIFLANISLANETGLKITSVGAWAQGSETFYFRVDRTIGPSECRNTLVKVNLYHDSDTQAELMSKNMVRSMALAAFASGATVELSLKSTCLYGNPTIDQIWLSK